MKHKLQRTLACLLALTLLTCPALAASSFPDVDENTDYAEAAEYLKDVGIMQGDDKGNFNPDNTVTRAEMATIICNVLGETENLKVSDIFSDVPATHWANKYITKAAELGFVSGYGGGKFGPNDPVTYEHAVTMVVRAVGLNGMAIEYGGYPDGYIKIALESGFLTNISSQKGVSLNRSEIAILLFNYYNNNV